MADSSAPARRPPAAKDSDLRARELPHSTELERAVLAVLLDGRHAVSMQKVRPHIEHPLIYYRRDHRLIYQACLDLDDAGERIDAQAVAELLLRTRFETAIDRIRQQQMLLDSDSLDGLTRMQRRALYTWRPEDEAADMEDSALAAVGGYAGLAEVAGSQPSAAGLERNADLIKDDYLKRRLIQQLSRITDSAYRTTDNFGSLIDTSSQSLLGLSKLSTGKEIYDMAGVVDDTLEQIEERRDNPAGGVLTGYTEIDEMLMSLRPGGLYILAARPGVGKTSFALSIVQHVCCDAEEPAGSLFFSLEVDRVDLVKKLICGKASLDFRKLEMGQLDDAEWQALADTADDLKNWRLDLMDVSDLTVQGLRSVVKRHVLERDGDCKLVIIDYLQLLGSARPGINDYEKISEISRTLKIVARELSVPIVALSQMSRESERGGQPREPRLSDLRGSGSIEQDADAVLFLHRMDQEDDENTAREGRRVKLVLAKNRFGPIGSSELRFFPAKQKFVVVPRNELHSGGGPVPEVQIPKSERYDVAPSSDEDLFGPA